MESVITFFGLEFHVFRGHRAQRILKHAQNLCKRFQMPFGGASNRLESCKTLQWVWIVKILQIWTSREIDRLAPIMTINDRDSRVGREFGRLGSRKYVGGRLRVQFYSQ